MKEAELNQRELILNKKEMDLLKKESELSKRPKQKIIIEKKPIDKKQKIMMIKQIQMK